MPRLDNEHWELFAQGVAKGLTLTKAYIKAGYEVEPNVAQANSSRLLSNAIVSDRVAELQELAAQKTLVTIEKLTDELEEARNLAMKDDKGAAAAVSAVMAKAKLHGLDVNKIDATIKAGITVTITQDEANF
jgi:phage terminase small subunit